jgi:hypothetical protein
MRPGLPPFKVSGALHLAFANPSTFKASVCAERTAGPHCIHALSGWGTPVVSHTGVETPNQHDSPSATLAKFHTTECADQTNLSRRAKPSPSLALARSARWCLAGSGGNATRAMPPAPPESDWVEAYTWSESAGTRCGLEAQPESALVNPKPVVSQSGWTSGGREASVPQVAVVVRRRWSNPEASMQRVLSQAAHRLCSRGPQRLVVLCKRPSNNQFQRSVNSRLRRLSPPAELGRWAP